VAEGRPRPGQREPVLPGCEGEPERLARSRPYYIWVKGHQPTAATGKKS